MILIFQGGNETVKYDIDREKKILRAASSQSNYRLIRQPWRMLFDKGKETNQEELTDKLNDDGFKKAIILAMAQIGYELKKAE